MFLTQDDAKKKWCPMGALLAGVTAVGLAIGDEVKNPLSREACIVLKYCAASECMMWRKQWADGNALDDGQGYCGLAGKPEEV